MLKFSTYIYKVFLRNTLSVLTYSSLQMLYWVRRNKKPPILRSRRPFYRSSSSNPLIMIIAQLEIHNEGVSHSIENILNFLLKMNCRQLLLQSIRGSIDLSSMSAYRSPFKFHFMNIRPTIPFSNILAQTSSFWEYSSGGQFC